MRQWEWAADMNGDGLVTIRDIPMWVSWMFTYPGDLVVWWLVEHRPEVASFFELTHGSYGGGFSQVVSALAVVAGLVLLGGLALVAEAFEGRRWQDQLFTFRRDRESDEDDRT